MSTPVALGPTLPISEEIHRTKYRQDGETFREAMGRIASTLSDGERHFYEFRDIILHQRFMPAGRVQSAIGSPRQTTAYNCFVSPPIPDSMDGIMDCAKLAARTMRMGGGIGYDFSTLRPAGDLIVSLESSSSGPVSFMDIFDSVCGTISSSGHRRGAQMGVLRVDHPDIEQFVEAKTNSNKLTNFNISVGVTDEFMTAVRNKEQFDLRFDGKVYKRIDAHALWEKIMRATWDWAEPGILFIDRINEMNNLWYCETIAATNPCAEQPLPPYGACLLGSFNLVKYLIPNLIRDEGEAPFDFDWDAFRADIPNVIRAMDNVVDRTIYPLPEQRQEAESKRRMGIGITGFANTSEAIGYTYGSPECLAFEDELLEMLANEAYLASSDLAVEKGSFPLFNADKYLEGKFIQTLRPEVRERIRRNGLRNSHLLSIAPTGTISLSADNVSSGIEPPFMHYFDRTVIQSDGSQKVERVDDYAYRELKIEGRTANECSVKEHLDVLIVGSRWVDSAVSKTLNVGDHVTWEEFKDIYMTAWLHGCKGCTTFRAAGKRFGILNAASDEGEEEQDAPAMGDAVDTSDELQEQQEGASCTFDPASGRRTCE
tara:strand:- start:29797 stop:31593 length:1797 start_codon:yes stop_codon:yes gene_type:complete